MKNRPPRLLAGLLPAAAFYFFAALSPLYALTVTTSADENDTPAGANISLREAIRDTAPGGTVDFDGSLAGSTFFLTIGDLSITKNLSIDASGLTDPVHLVLATSQLNISGSVTVNVNNLTFSEGFNATNGGASFISGGAIVTFTDCVFANNRSTQSGGAIYSEASTLILSGCKFTCNEAEAGRGGAICGTAGGTVVTLTNTLLSGNRSGDIGGALHTQGSPTTTITDCTFLDNEGSFGGAFSQTNGTLMLTGSCIARNKSVTAGGGMFLWVGTVATMQNSTVSGNSSGDGGGIVLHTSSTMDMDNCTVIRNTARNRAGGVFVNTDCTLDIANSIVAQNSAKTGTDFFNNSATIIRSEKNLVGSNIGVETEFPDGQPNANGDAVGTPSSPLDPGLSLLGYYGGDSMCHHPLAGSPAINGGGATSLVTDQRGFGRVISSILDLGAVEAGPVFVVDTAVDENDGIGTGGKSLRDCVNAVTVPGTRIVFSAGVNGATLTLTLGAITTSDLEIFIDASAMSNGITIDGNSGGRIFNAASTLADTTLALDSLDLINGSAAAINASNEVKLTAANCTFMDNTSSLSGGAISLQSASHLVAHRCIFEDNSTSSIGGGAIYGSSDSTMYIAQSEFISNDVTGGAAEGRGGAIYSIVAPFHVEDSLFISNNASGFSTSVGGAIYYTNTLSVIPQKTTVLNSTFLSNNANDNGGAIAIKGTVGDITCRHLTITGNISTLGGGMFIERTGSTTDSLTIDHCIIAGNNAPIYADVYYNPIGGGSAQMNTSGPNLIGDNSSASAIFPAGPLVGTFGAEVSAELGSLGSYGGFTRTIYLTPASPAINAGLDGDDTPAYDQRGFARVAGSAPDLGAYENGNANGYSLWTMESIPIGEDDSFGGNVEDDSNTNGIEYATGLSPTAVDTGQVLSAELMPDGLGGYEMHLTFSYEPTAPDLKYTIQRDSDDLIGFVSRYSLDLSTGVELTPIGANVTATVDPGNKTITVVDGDLSSLLNFWQLKVEIAP